MPRRPSRRTLRLTTGAKIALIIMLCSGAFCVWSLAWMALSTFRLLRDAFH